MRWDIGRGGPVGPIKLRTFSPGFAASLKPGDIGCVREQNHHFLIETINGGGPLPPLTSIDGNTLYGRIQMCIRDRSARGSGPVSTTPISERLSALPCAAPGARERLREEGPRALRTLNRSLSARPEH